MHTQGLTDTPCRSFLCWRGEAGQKARGNTGNIVIPFLAQPHQRTRETQDTCDKSSVFWAKEHVVINV